MLFQACKTIPWYFQVFHDLLCSVAHIITRCLPGRQSSRLLRSSPCSAWASRWGLCSCAWLVGSPVWRSLGCCWQTGETVMLCFCLQLDLRIHKRNKQSEDRLLQCLSANLIIWVFKNCVKLLQIYLHGTVMQCKYALCQYCTASSTLQLILAKNLPLTQEMTYDYDWHVKWSTLHFFFFCYQHFLIFFTHNIT